MADISQLSDADLQSLAGGASQPASAAPPPITSLTDAELGQHQAALPSQPYGILPLSEDPQGNTHFDINAGLTGMALRAISAPHDVMTGELDPRSPEANQRAFDLATMFTPMNPAMRAGARAIPGDILSSRQGKPPVPSATELKTAASQGYDAARATGAEYPGEAIGSFAQTMQQGLENDGILGELAPQTHAILGRLQSPPAGSTVTITSLDAARKALNRVAGNFQNPTEQEAARRVIAGIDQHITDAGTGAGTAPGGVGSNLPVPASAAGAGAANGAGAGGLVEDPLTQASRLIQEARGNAAARFRSDRITGVEDAADLRAAAANSGQNGGNTLRQRLASLLLNDKQSRGFAPDELDAMRQVVNGTATSNTLRYVSNLLGGGGGVGHTAIAGLGGAIGAGMGGGMEGAGIGAALASGLGSGTRTLYNGLVKRQVQKIDEMLRMRSPLYQGRPTPLLPNRSDLAAGIGARGLLMGNPQGQDETAPNPLSMFGP